MRAFPEVMKEILKFPRAYIGNVIHTLVGKPFADWVKKQIDLRNEKVKEEKDMMIEMDPEIARIFRQSTSVSGKYSFIFMYFQDTSTLICYCDYHCSNTCDYSLQGYLQQPDEANRPAAEDQGADPGGQVEGGARAKGGGEEAGRARADAGTAPGDGSQDPAD